MRRTLALMVLLALAVPALAGERLVERHWYEMLIGDTKAGWMSVAVFDDGRSFRTVNETRIRMHRQRQVVEVNVRTEFLETHRGEAVQISSRSDMSSQTVDTLWLFFDDHITQTTRQGAKETTTRLALPRGKWLMPQAE